METVCPACAETIKAAAIKCKHCGQDVDAAAAAVERAKLNATDLKPGQPSLAMSCVALVFFSFVGLMFLVMILPESKSKPAPKAKDSYKVTYHVGGSAEEASVTFENDSGGTSQKRVSLPWNETFKAPPGTYLYVSAQNQSRYGTLEVQIKLDGKVVQQGESNEEFGIAKASGKI